MELNPIIHKVDFHNYELVFAAAHEESDTMHISLYSKSGNSMIDQIKINKPGEVIGVLNKLKRKVERLEKAMVKHK